MIASTNNIPEIIVALATLVGAVGALITAIFALKTGNRNSGKIEEVHDTVNSQKDTVEARNNQLAETLKAHDIEIPAKTPNT